MSDTPPLPVVPTTGAWAEPDSPWDSWMPMYGVKNTGKRKAGDPMNPVNLATLGEFALKWGAGVADLVSRDPNGIGRRLWEGYRFGWDPSHKDAQGNYIDVQAVAHIIRTSSFYQANYNADGTPKPGGPGPKTAGDGSSIVDDIRNAAAAIRNESDTLGLSLSDQQVNSIAGTAVHDKWKSEQLTDYLTNGLDYTKLRAGTLTGGVDQIKMMANDQLLRISDSSAENYSRRLASGEIDKLGLQSLFQEQAKKNYAWASPVIDKGITMKDYLLPSRDFIAKELEQSPEAIDLMDPKWLGMMQATDAKTGLVRSATMSEMQTNARHDESWSKTGAARNIATTAAEAIRSFMGA